MDMVAASQELVSSHLAVWVYRNSRQMVDCFQLLNFFNIIPNGGQCVC